MWMTLNSHTLITAVQMRTPPQIVSLTDCVNQANHTIDWKKTMVINREQDRSTRWIKEAVHICKEGHRAMNQKEGSYQLSHVYDRFLDATADRRINTRKNWVPASSDEDLVMKSKRQKNKVLFAIINFYLYRLLTLHNKLKNS